jgi:aspartyl-tRNA(Asn)/glutamyl-tRNA(Gln) amidotransferase subunit A
MNRSWPNISEAAKLIRRGELEPLELVDACLDRIRKFDSLVQAWVVVDADTARREAERLGQMACRGDYLGPLHGIPIGVKDIFDVHGLPTKAGSRLREGHVASSDATVVARLRQQGAIILGKTVTTQFACFDPSVTRNPWNLNHTPGGSSSGSAAAVAMGMCLAALGSQTGGSITRPASYCGVAGLKPTFGAVSTRGVVPVSFHLDHVGVIAPCVEDLLIMFAAIADRPLLESIDVLSGEDDKRGTEIFDRKRSTENPPRLYVIEDFFLEQADDSGRQATRAAIGKLVGDNTVQSLPLPDSFGEVHTMHRRIMAVEAAEVHQQQYTADPSAYSPFIASLIEEGLSIAAVDYAAALKHQQQFRQAINAMFPAGSIALTPATKTPAPATLETTGDPAFNSPWSCAGLPTVNIPCGLAPDGMPCGLQLVAALNSESHLLAAALWCEHRLGFHASPPVLRSVRGMSRHAH